MIPAPVAGTAAVAGIAIAAVFVLAGQASPASVGAGIQAAPVSVAVPQGSRRQVQVTLANTGSGPESLAVRADGPVPASWIHGSTVTLAPGTEGTAQVTVTVPAGAALGQRRGYLETGAAPGTAAGANFGAAALADLVVTVVPSASSAH